MTLSYIPITKPFLKTLAQGLLHQTNHDPSALMDITILLPTRRACRNLRDIFLDLMNGKPILLPRMQAVADVDADEILLLLQRDHHISSIPPAISNLERLSVLTQLVSKFQPTLHFDQCTSLSQSLIQFLDTLQRENLSLDRLDDIVGAEFSDHWKMILCFLNILRTTYPKYLEIAGKIDPIERQNILLDSLYQYWTQHPPQHQIIAAGITGSIKATRPLLKCIHNLPQGNVIVPGFIPDFNPDILRDSDIQHPYHELLSVIKDIGARWEDVHPWDANPDHDNPSTLQNTYKRSQFFIHSMTPSHMTEQWSHKNNIDIHDDLFDHFDVCEADNILEEGQIVAALIRQTLEDPKKTVAVIAPNRSISKSILSACLEYGITLNDSGGSPITECKNTHFILLILDLILTDYHPVSFIEFLRHPFFNKHISDEDLSFLDQKVFRGYRIEKEDIIPFLKSISASEDIIHQINIIFDALETLSPFLKENGAMSKIVYTHLAAAEKLSHIHDGASVLWQDEEGDALGRIFDAFLDTSINGQNFSLSEYKSILLRYMSQIRVNKIGYGHPRASILGVYESRLIHADHIIITGFNEGIWPSQQSQDPWMSRGMRKSYGLPDSDVSIGRMALDLIQLLSAPRISITRSLMLNSRPTMESRWLSRMNVLLKTTSTKNINFYNTILPLWIKKKNITDHGYKPFIPTRVHIPKHIKPTEFYATDIDTFSDNPYFFFIDKILGLNPLDSYDIDPDARIRGILIHNTLDSFIKGNINNKIPFDEESLLNTYHQCAKDLFISRSNQSLIKTRMYLSLLSFFQLEKQRRQNGFIPLHTEKKLESIFDLHNGTIHLKARFDRIDHDQTGNLCIIDYKTSKTPPSLSKIINGEKPQLGIEMTILASVIDEITNHHNDRSISSAFFWPIHPNSHDLRIFDEQEIEKIIENVRSGIRELFSSYYDDFFSFHYLQNKKESFREQIYTHYIRKQEWNGFIGDIIGEENE